MEKVRSLKELIEEQKQDIIDSRNKIDQIKTDIIDEATTLKELDYLNKIEFEKLEIKYGELTKRVFDYQINCNLKDNEIHWAKKTMGRSKDTIGQLEK